MNVVIAALRLQTITSFSPVVTLISGNTYLENCYFSKMAGNVLFAGLRSRISAVIFHTMFRETKAVSSISRSKNKCSDVVNVVSPHQKAENVCMNFRDCKFLNCRGGKHGGACHILGTNVTFVGCVFSNCSATYGGTLWVNGPCRFELNESQITDSDAERFGAIYCEGHELVEQIISSTNITSCRASSFVAGIRLDHGKPNVRNCVLANMESPQFGAIWDWSQKPLAGHYFACSIVNVSSKTPGLGITFYHWISESVVEKCTFTGCSGPEPMYVYLYSSECVITVKDCVFDVEKSAAVGERYGDNVVVVDEKNRFAGREAL